MLVMLLLALIAVGYPVGAYAQATTATVKSLAPLDDKSELASSLKKFKATSIVESDLKRDGRRLAYELGTVLTYEGVPGETVIVPVVDEKTRKLVAIYYLYTKDRDRERSAIIENVDRERTIRIGEPGKLRSLKLSFDDKGKFVRAETMGPEPKFWGCVGDTMQKLPPFFNSFSGAVCSACLVTVAVPPCIACGTILGGFVSYSLYSCPL